MIRCTFILTGTSDLSFSKPIQSIKNTGEAHGDFEERTWLEKLHVASGEVFIPAANLKSCLYDVAKFLGESVPGKRGSTYTKHFDAGIFVFDPIPLGIKVEKVEYERLFVPSDGKRGGGKRVWKKFPVIRAGWKGTATIYLVDPILMAKPQKVEEYARHAGKFIGMGRYRPRNGGDKGRFDVSEFSWSDYAG